MHAIDREEEEREKRRLSPAAYADLQARTATMPEKDREAVFYGMPPPEHRFAKSIAEVVDVEHACLVVPVRIEFILPTLRATDGFPRRLYPGANWTDEGGVTELTSDQARRVEVLPPHMRETPWVVLRAPDWCDVRRAMNALKIDEYEERQLPRDERGLPRDLEAGMVLPRLFTNVMSPALRNLLNNVIAADPVIGLAWCDVERVRGFMALVTNNPTIARPDADVMLSRLEGEMRELTFDAIARSGGTVSEYRHTYRETLATIAAMNGTTEALESLNVKKPKPASAAP